MTRLHVIVEGQTEESFVAKVLAPTLRHREIYARPIVLRGNVKYSRLRKDLLLLLKQERSTYCTTMLDFYGLGGDFPGLPVPGNMTNIEKVKHIEDAIKADIVAAIEDRRPDIRLLPYLQLHEFEGLLFSDPRAFASGIHQDQLVHQFEAIRNQFATPEDINDDPHTAPSKRVLASYPAYQKVVDGTLGAQAVGITRMRQECPHFRTWIETLETLPAL